ARPAHSEGFDDTHRALAAPPQPAALGAAGTLRAGAFRPRARAIAAPFRLYPVWRRPAHLHRRGLRAGGTLPHPCDPRPALSPYPEAGLCRRASGTHHASPAPRHAHAPRAATLIVRPRLSPNAGAVWPDAS